MFVKLAQCAIQLQGNTEYRRRALCARCIPVMYWLQLTRGVPSRLACVMKHFILVFSGKVSIIVSLMKGEMVKGDKDKELSGAS